MGFFSTAERGLDGTRLSFCPCFYNYISIVYSVMKKIQNKKPDIIPDLTVDFKNLNEQTKSVRLLLKVCDCQKEI
jgi:hypothetical protein